VLPSRGISHTTTFLNYSYNQSNMNKIILLLAILLMLPSVFAGTVSDGVEINSFELDELEADINYIHFDAETTDGYSDEMFFTLSIPELGVWDYMGAHNTRKDDRVRNSFELDLRGVPSEYYYARLTISASGYSRGLWYEVYVE
jgi:hypothetical protein